MTLNEAKINVRELEAQVATATEAEDAVYQELKAIQTRLTDARAARFEAEDNLRDGRYALHHAEKAVNVAVANQPSYLSMSKYWVVAHAVQDATRSTKSREFAIAIMSALETAQGKGGMRFEDLHNVCLCNGKELTEAMKKRVWDKLARHCPHRHDNGEDNYRLATRLGTPYPIKLDNDGFIEPAHEVQW